MKVWQYEIRKLLIGHRLLCVVILFPVLAALIGLAGDSVIDSAANLEGYHYYLSQVEGLVTAETEAYMQTTAGAFAEMESEFQTIYRKVSNGQLTREESGKRIEELEAHLRMKKGFLALYDQYMEAKEDGDSRYLLDTAPWEAMLSADRLELPLILFVLLLACVCFGMEITSEMDVMLRISVNGEKRVGAYKLVLVTAMSVLGFLAEYGIRAAVYQWKYGFDHGDYPLQSLAVFHSYSGTVSIMEACVGIFLWKLLGVLLWSVIACALMVWLRNYMVTMMGAFSGLILAYIGIPKEHLKYCVPGPLGALLGTGFYRGSEYTLSEFGEQKVYSFVQMSAPVQYAILLADILLLVGLGCYVINRYANVWSRQEQNRTGRWRRRLFVLAGCLCIGGLTGCGRGAERSRHPFNLQNSYCCETERYFLYYDLEQGILVREKEGAETVELVRDAFRENKEILNAFYGEGDYAYYIEMTHDREETYGVNEYDTLSLIRVRLTDFSSRVLYSVPVRSEKKDVFGIRETHNENFDLFTAITDFLVYGNRFCFLTMDGEVYDVDLRTGSRKFLFSCDGMSLSFVDGSFYYTDTVSRLMRYDLAVGESVRVGEITASEFLVTENYVVYKDRMAADHLFCAERNGEEPRELYAGTTYFLAVDRDYVYYMDEADILHEVDFQGREKQSIPSSLLDTICVYEDYDGILIDAYEGSVVEWKK